ncbi:MAG: hypothetical protein ACRDPT_12255 [Streptomycetales bacterium]
MDDLELVTDSQRRLYHQLQSAEMLTHVESHLGLLAALLDGSPADRFRRRIASAAAEAAGFAAWLRYDLGDDFHMLQRYRFASDAVTEAGDAGLRSYIRAYQGMVAAEREGPGAAAGYLASARQGAPRSLSRITRAWLVALHATALGHLGEARSAMRCLGQAQDDLDHASTDDRDPWMYDFDNAALAIRRGQCCLALGRPHRAVIAFEEALGGLPEPCARRGAEVRISLAHARLRCGDADEAARLGSVALTLLAARGSMAGLSRVRQLRNVLWAAGHLAATRTLDEQARALRGAGT